MDRFNSWLADQMNNVDGLPAHLGAIILVAVVLAIGIALLIWAGPMRLNRKNRDAEAALFGDEAVTAAHYRDRAQRCAEAGDWTGALRETFRALVREQIERGIIADIPGLTATEAAAACAARYPDRASELQQVTHMVEAVWFGGRAGTQPEVERAKALDQVLRSERPVQVATPTSLAVPT